MIRITSDGGYIMAGTMYDFVSNDVYVLKTDASGNVQFSKTYGGTSSAQEEYAYDIRQTTDGGYIVTGRTNLLDPNYDVYLLKLDAVGTLQWSQTFGCVNTDWGDAILQTSDGGYLISGQTFCSSALGNAYLIKTDASGTIQWTNTYGGAGVDEEFYDVQSTSDGGYIMTGWTPAFGAGGYDVFLVKTDVSGNVLWSKTFGGTGNDFGTRVRENASGNYIVCGWTDSYGSGSNDMYFLKTDSGGNLLWSKTFGNSLGELAFDLQIATDGNYVLSGYTYLTAADRQACLIKTDTDGTMQWAMSYGGSLDENALSVKQTSDGGFIIGAYTTSFAWNPHVYLIKTNSSGISGCNESPVALASTTPPTVVSSPSFPLSNMNFSGPPPSIEKNLVLLDSILCTSGCLVAATISGTTTICSGQSTTLTASGGNSYSWSTGSTTASITTTATVTATYTVIVSDTATSGCSDTAFATVVVNPSVTASVSSNTTLCSGQTVTLTASGGNNYSWSNAATTSSITVSPSANTTYSVSVSNGNCSDTASTTVTVNPLPVISVSGNTFLCSGDSTTLTASGGIIYSWNTNATTSSITVIPSSTTNYFVVATNSSGCSDSASVTVTVSPAFTASVSGTTTICSGQTATLTASGGGNYNWSTGQTTNPISVSPSTNTTYSVIVSIGSCADTASATIAVNPSPTASVSGSTTICSGDSATLIASGGVTYSWNTGQTVTSIVVNPITTANYSVIVSSANGCTDTASGTVTVTTNVTASVSGNNNLCQGETATLAASGGINYAWSTGATTSSISASTAGNYSVIVSIGNCSDTASVSVTINPNPTASAVSNVTIAQGQSATLTATGGGTYLWSNGTTGAAITVSPSSTTDYCVTVMDVNGCTDSSCVRVTVEPMDCSGEIFLPNAFSPNGDLENDELQIYYENFLCIKSLHIIIYNRWGEKVFESFEKDFKWDGNSQNKVPNTAVYTYYLAAEMNAGKKIVVKGNVSLIR